MHLWTVRELMVSPFVAHPFPWRKHQRRNFWPTVHILKYVMLVAVSRYNKKSPLSLLHRIRTKVCDRGGTARARESKLVEWKLAERLLGRRDARNGAITNVVMTCKTVFYWLNWLSPQKRAAAAPTTTDASCSDLTNFQFHVHFTFTHQCKQLRKFNV